MSEKATNLTCGYGEDGARKTLRDTFMERYADLRGVLTRQLGSRVAAEDALHDTYLRLDGIPDSTEISSARAYLIRIATNLATDKMRREKRVLSVGEIAELLDVDDGRPTPETVAQDASDVALLTEVLRGMPRRRREILLASRMHEIRHRDLAQKYGVTTRTVELEIKRALEECAARVGRAAIQRFGPKASRSSLCLDESEESA